MPNDQSAWPMIAGNSLLLAAVGVRPMMDVLWSQSVQPGNPCKSRTPCRECARGLTCATQTA